MDKQVRLYVVGEIHGYSPKGHNGRCGQLISSIPLQQFQIPLHLV
jgi:hypothetical protein